MPNLERMSFEMKDGKQDKRKLSTTKRVLGTIAVGAVHLMGQETTPPQAKQVLPPVIEKAEYKSHIPIIFNPAESAIMRKTGIKFRGNGLHLFRANIDIDLMQDGLVTKVVITSKGENGLVVTIFKKPQEQGGQPAVEVLEIENGKPVK